MSDSVFIVQLGWVHNGRNIPKFDKFDKIYTIKKSCRDIKFLLYWKHSPQFSGTAPKTFMPIQTPDLHRSNNVLHKSCLTTFSANESVIVNQKMPVFGFQIATKE